MLFFGYETVNLACIGEKHVQFYLLDVEVNLDFYNMEYASSFTLNRRG